MMMLFCFWKKHKQIKELAECVKELEMFLFLFDK